MIKDQVWWPGNQCCGQTTNPKHRFKTTISNFVVISEELTKNSPEITRLPKMGPTHWYYVNYGTECNCKYLHWPMETKLTDELFEAEISSRSSTRDNSLKELPRLWADSKISEFPTLSLHYACPSKSAGNSNILESAHNRRNSFEELSLVFKKSRTYRFDCFVFLDPEVGYFKNLVIGAFRCFRDEFNPPVVAFSRTSHLSADRRYHWQGLVANKGRSMTRTSIPDESPDQRKTRRDPLSRL